MNAKTSFFLSFFLVILLGGLLVTGYVFAQTDYGLGQAAGAAGLTKGTTLPALLGSVIGTVLSLVGVVFFALMLYGGFTWMLSRGNQENEKKAMSIITAAIVGIVVVLSSYAITSFVFKSVGGIGSGGGDKANECGKKVGTEEYSCMQKDSCKEDTIKDNLCMAEAADFKCCEPKEGIGKYCLETNKGCFPLTSQCNGKEYESKEECESNKSEACIIKQGSNDEAYSHLDTEVCQKLGDTACTAAKEDGTGICMWVEGEKMCHANLNDTALKAYCKSLLDDGQSACKNGGCDYVVGPKE